MLELKNIKKSYDGVTVLKNIDLTISDGEIVSILGPSGCGKTTLLNLILGLTDADSGKIIFDGQDITNVPMEKRGFNIVFQDYALFPNLNVMQNITYGLKNTPNISTQEEVNELIELLGLKPHLNKKIDQLSGGQKQRVALARTMVMKPKILLLDEPLSALDGVIKESIKEKIKQIARDYHLTTIIVTHDPEEALTLSDKVLIVNDGSISQYGAPEEIITTPQNAFIKEFILNQLEIKRNNIFASGNHGTGGINHGSTERKRNQSHLCRDHLTVCGVFSGSHHPPVGRILCAGYRMGHGKLYRCADRKRICRSIRQQHHHFPDQCGHFHSTSVFPGVQHPIYELRCEI